MKLIIYLVCIFPISLGIAAGADLDSQDMPKQGLYSLPVSQQPGPDVSLGQNIIGKGQLQLYLMPFYTRNKNEHYLDQTNSLLYGITDDSSILLNVPISVDYYSDYHHSSGIGDLSLQGEYGFYSNNTSLATIVGSISAPTGSTIKNPATGMGVPTYFLGTTFNQTFVNWLWFTSPGVLWAPSHNGTKPGTQYLYQVGVGRNIHSVPDKYIFSSLLEFTGDYYKKDAEFMQVNPNSGGSVIYITPSLWFSTQSLIVELGISIPVFQRWNGVQNRNNYIAGLVLGWTFS